MLSNSETRSSSLGFGRYLSKLAGLGAFGFAVWAGLFAAASWQHEQGLHTARSRLDRQTAASTQHTPNTPTRGIRQ